MSTLMGSPSGVMPDIGLPHSQSPCEQKRQKSRSKRYLSVRVDRRADAEAVLPVEQHPVEQIALARPVHACDRDHANRPIDGAQKCLCFFGNIET